MTLRAHLLIALSLVGIFSFFGCSNDGQKPIASDLSGTAPQPAAIKPIELARWRETPCLIGRAASQDDVAAGLAVFAAPGTGSQPIELKLPRCAIHTDEQTGQKTPVIVVQAEMVGGLKTIGCRFLVGGDGVCLLSELKLLDGPDARFK